MTSCSARARWIDKELEPASAACVARPQRLRSGFTETNQDSSLETEQTALIGMGVLPDSYQVNAGGLLTQATWTQSSMLDYAVAPARVADYDKYYRPERNASTTRTSTSTSRPPTGCASPGSTCN